MTGDELWSLPLPDNDQVYFFPEGIFVVEGGPEATLSRFID